MSDFRYIGGLYGDAKKGGGFQFVYTLIRMEGLTRNKPDSLVSFYRFLQATKQNAKADRLEISGLLTRVIEEYDAYSLIANLINNALGQSYKLHPLPSTRNAAHVDALLQKAEHYTQKNPEFCRALTEIFSENVRNVYRGSSVFSNAEEERRSVMAVIDFLHEVLKRYFRILKAFKKGPTFYPDSRSFDVVELVVDTERGLCGINVHHSNGSLSYFKRNPDGTDGANYICGPTGEMMLNVGRLDMQQPIWLVSGTPLYEIGTPGRYNRIGEWRPLVYPGDSQLIQRRAAEQTTDEKDRRIAGCLFYIMATTHHAIEFLVKTDFEMPGDYFATSINGMRFEMHKVDMSRDEDSPFINLCVYDCTLYLGGINVDAIKRALEIIDVFLNRLAFRIDGSAEWFLKYQMYGSGRGKKLLGDKEFRFLGEYMLGLKSPDHYRIDAAMSWYNTGKLSTNEFTKFLNYYVAIESLAIPLADGELELSTRYGIETAGKEERRRRTEECLRALHDEKYVHGAIEFVEQGYFECIRSLRSKTELALKKVFGEQHDSPALFFDKSTGKSIYELRNDLAHGNFNHIDREHAQMVKEKLPLLENMAYEFIMRLSTELGTKNSRFSHHSLGISMSDPRGTLVGNSLAMLPHNDWRIRWEWLT